MKIEFVGSGFQVSGEILHSFLGALGAFSTSIASATEGGVSNFPDSSRVAPERDFLTCRMAKGR
jgi:hypothetical protein